MKPFTKLILSAILAFTLLAITGCNTVKGIGKDIESLGESMQEAGD
jgi:predicted small secreted protein